MDSIEKKVKKKYLIYSVIVIVVIAAVFMLIVYQDKVKKDYSLDQSAQDGRAELTDGGNKNQDLSGSFRMMIHVSPIFENGSAEGELMITNPKENKQNTQVDIFLDDTDEQIYSSDILEPGGRVRYATLTKNLEKGIYPATAYFNIIDRDNNEVIGKSAAQIEITIQN